VTTDYEARIAELRATLDTLGKTYVLGCATGNVALEAVALLEKLSRSLSSEKARREGLEREAGVEREARKALIAECERGPDCVFCDRYWWPESSYCKPHAAGCPVVLAGGSREPTATVPEIAEGAKGEPKSLLRPAVVVAPLDFSDPETAAKLARGAATMRALREPCTAHNLDTNGICIKCDRQIRKGP
jgi:hypothetical protein